MQTVVRYSVVNQDGKPVIRAVPVRRRIEDRPTRIGQPTVSTPPNFVSEGRDRSFVRKLRRLRLRDM